MKTKQPLYIMLFGVVTRYSDFKDLLFFLYGLIQYNGLHKVPGEGSASLNQEDSIW